MSLAFRLLGGRGPREALGDAAGTSLGRQISVQPLGLSVQAGQRCR